MCENWIGERSLIGRCAMTTNPYESPKADCAPQRTGAPRPNWMNYSNKYHGAFRVGLTIQMSLAALTALVLDLGFMHRAFWVAVVCQWAMAWMILFRRPTNPTQLDLAIVRYGIIPLFAAVAGLGPVLLGVLGIESYGAMR